VKGTLYAVIPLLNEEGNIDSVMNALRQTTSSVGSDLLLKMIAVDDGSTDSTNELLRNCQKDLDLTVLVHDQNLGPGSAFATAFEHLADRLAERDWVVTMEGDSTSSDKTLLHMLQRRKEGYDVVLASPYAYGGGMIGVEFNRVFLSHCANALAKLLLGLRGIHTLSSFFRLYSSSAVKKLQASYGPRIIESTGFECMVEMLVKLVATGARISEVEMAVDWRQRKGRSKMRRFKAMRGYLRLLLVARKWMRSAGEQYWKPVVR